MEPVTALYIEVSKDGLTGGIQLSIDAEREGGGGYGYRLAGPKFNGSSSIIKRHRINRRDADELRRYLDLVFPAKTSSRCIHGKRDDEDCAACDEMTADFEHHDCGEDTCVCADPKS